jgi:hypothetical protein
LDAFASPAGTKSPRFGRPGLIAREGTPGRGHVVGALAEGADQGGVRMKYMVMMFGDQATVIECMDTAPEV